MARQQAGGELVDNQLEDSQQIGGELTWASSIEAGGDDTHAPGAPSPRLAFMRPRWPSQESFASRHRLCLLCHAELRSFGLWPGGQGRPA